ncbi:hypothetical protein GCM10027596_10070 [Nocardioides korecus]
MTTTAARPTRDAPQAGVARPPGDGGGARGARVRQGVVDAFPGVLCWLLAVVLAHRVGGYPVGDLLRYSAYVAVHLTLTGTLLLRLVTRERVTRIGELALGTVVGLLAEAGVYAVVLALGHPHAILAWPAVVLLAILGWRLRTRRGDATPLPRVPARRGPGSGAGWALALMAAYVVVRVAADQWSVHPDTLASLRAPYVDEQYHLALVGELRHHLPPQVPYVLGTPLGYHWLWYVHVAAASWVTGTEPVLLVRGLDPALLLVLTLLAVAEVTSRLVPRPATPGATRPARPAWAGVAAAVAFLGVTPGFLGWAPASAPSGWPQTAARAFLSPTFVYALPFTLLALLLLDRLVTGSREEAPVGARAVAGWGGLLVVLVAAGAAKSSSLPPLLAGTAVVAGWRTLRLLGAPWPGRRRRPRESAVVGGWWRACLALVLAGVALAVDRRVFWGSGNRSLVVDPLRTLVRSGESMSGLSTAAGTVPLLVVVVLAVSFLLAKAAPALGATGHLRPQAPRSATPLLLVATLAAGVGATLVLDHVALSQHYFTWSVLVVAPLLTGTGLAAALPRRLRRAEVLTLAATAVLATLWTLVVHAVAPGSTHPAGPHATTANTLEAVAVPLVEGWGGLLVLVLLVRLVARRRDLLRGPTVGGATLLLAAAVAGSGAVVVLAEAPTLVHAVATDRADVATAPPLIGPGGIESARWLRRHSAPTDLVATNGHCTSPGDVFPRCDHRAFWRSGYSERRVLVEGWAYVSPTTVGLPSTPLTNSNRTPFWDPPRLAANQRAFYVPTRAALEVLRRRYGVDWLLVDRTAVARGRTPQLGRLEELATVTFRSGDYVVLRLR